MDLKENPFQFEWEQQDGCLGLKTENHVNLNPAIWSKIGIKGLLLKIIT